MPELYTNLTPAERMDYIRDQANILLLVAAEMGLCLTIERTPLQPLAMGHAANTVTVWPARVMAAPAVRQE